MHVHKFNPRFNTKTTDFFSRRDTKHVQKTGMKCLREYSKSQKVGSCKLYVL